LGTFVKTFVVDGEEFDLYAWSDGEATTYDLLRGCEVVWLGLVKLPDEETVIGLVRAVRGREADGA
jgi:hypothetical protein